MQWPENPDPEIAALARSLVPGAGEVQCSRLNDGLVNDTYRVDRDGRDYALRVRRTLRGELGHDHFWEARVLAAAEPMGLTPAIVLNDPQRGVLLTNWVRGMPVSNAQGRIEIERIAALIRAVQDVPIPSAPRIMTPRAWCNLYAHAGTNERLNALGGAAERHLRSIESVDLLPPVLCHSDLHRGNVLVSGTRLIVLDWEYAHVGDAWWDLAAWSCNNDFTSDSSAVLLESYLGARANAVQLGRFAATGWLYDYVCLLWSERYAAAHPMASNDFASRSEVLAVRLQR
jgi:thiamine kinase